MTSSNTYVSAALALHEYLLQRHWNGHALVGPDPVGKVHWRVTRFVRSYLPWLPNDDRYVYLQGQAYWIKSNLQLWSLTQDDNYLQLAAQSADYLVGAQLENGAWLHPPIRGRKGFISTVEGVWASLGLVAAFEATGCTAYLNSAIRWYDFQSGHIGFEKAAAGLAANYYAHSRHSVPNVTTMSIWLTVELQRLAGDDRFLQYTEPMLAFIENSQLPSGELPYVYQRRPHFMCFQYNSFQFLDLAYTHSKWPHPSLERILPRMAAFLSTGVHSDGRSRYNCFRDTPDVTYWGGALATALGQAHEMGLGDYHELSERAYQRLCSRQNAQGGFPFSRQNYILLQDRRSYPRYQAMILHQLLCRAPRKGLSSPPNAIAPDVAQVAARRRI